MAPKTKIECIFFYKTHILIDDGEDYDISLVSSLYNCHKYKDDIREIKSWQEYLEEST